MRGIAKAVLWAMVVAVAGGGGALARPCTEIDTDLERAINDRELDRLYVLFQEALDASSGCDADYLKSLRRDIANAFVAQTYDWADAGRNRIELIALLRRGYKFKGTWQLLSALAELQRQDGKHDEAALNAQVAINDYIDDEFVPSQNTEPSEEQRAALAHLVKLARETQALADSFAAPPGSKSGWGGLFHPEISKSFGFRAKPVPVEFVDGSVKLSAKGLAALEMLYKYLSDVRPKGVRVQQYSGLPGGKDHNATLSGQRAIAVKTYLEGKGLLAADGSPIRIETNARGEKSPMQRVEPGTYSQKEIDQLNRRIVLLIEE